MLLPFVLVVCLAGVLCLSPLAVYLLWLALLQRRDKPTVVAGRWDFTALLLGLSGFVIFGGALLLSLLQSNARFWMRGNFEALRDAWEQEKVVWSLIAATYVVLVVGGVALTLASRRRTLVVYNVDPGPFEVAVAEVFEHLGRPVERRGNLWVSGLPLFELEPFAAGKTVTLRWVSDDRHLFEEVERHLRSAVATLPPEDGPTARWLMSAAVGSMALVAVSLFLLVYGLNLLR